MSRRSLTGASLLLECARCMLTVVTASRWQHDDTQGLELLQKYAETVASKINHSINDELLPPFMLYVGGCDSSTEVMSQTRLMTKAVCNAELADVAFEFARKEWRTLKEAAADFSGQIIIKEAPESYFETSMPRGKEILDELQQMHGALAHVYRGNVLDKLVCTVRDCFNTKNKWTSCFPDLHCYPSDVGFPVLAADGQWTDTCFERRKSEIETKALINTTSMVTVLNQMFASIDNEHELAKNILKQAPSIDMSELWAFERDNTESSLQRSVDAWHQLLGVMPACSSIDSESMESKISVYLQGHEWRGSRPEELHNESIWNVAEVRDALMASGDERLINLLRL